jgi:predicted esterase
MAAAAAILLVLATSAGARAGGRETCPANEPSASPAHFDCMNAKAIDDPAKKRAEQRTSKLPAVATSAIERARQFKILVKRPARPSGDTLVLLHGSGGNETTLIPLAERVAPNAILMGMAGRVTQDGSKRWYQRITPTSFDQTDIRGEADALFAFLEDAVRGKKLDLGRTVFVGYSNGANILAAMSVLHPGLVRRAVLLRPMSVLDSIPAADLKAARFLVVVGEGDRTYAPFGPALEDMLRQRGARVDARTVKRGHLLGDEDVKVVGEWLAASDAVSMQQ